MRRIPAAWPWSPTSRAVDPTRSSRTASPHWSTSNTEAPPEPNPTAATVRESFCSSPSNCSARSLTSTCRRPRRTAPTPLLQASASCPWIRRPERRLGLASRPSRSTKGSTCLAGATFRSTRWGPVSARPPWAACRTWRSCSSPRPSTTDGGPAASTSTAASTRCANSPRRAPRRPGSTSRPCPAAPWPTRACSPLCNCRNSFQICATSVAPVPSRSFIAASRPTPSRPGHWRIHSDSLPTTARSTPSEATATGCTHVRQCWRARTFPGTWRDCRQSAPPTPRTRRPSIRYWNSCTSAAAASRRRC